MISCNIFEANIQRSIETLIIYITLFNGQLDTE